MENGSVQQVRSEREFQYGRAGRLATGAQASEDRGLVAAMTEIDPRLMSVGYGSFLTLEFGVPRLEIGEVHHHEARPEFPATRSRQVHVQGEWHLWIYCCSWTIEQERDAVARSESSREVIQVACKILDGQSLVSVEIVPSMGKTQFTFGLGAVLETHGEGYERADTSWMLFRPDRLTFSYRSDGYYSLVPSSAGSSGEWSPISDA